MCGLAACLWQTNRTLPPMKIIEAIQESASRVSHPDSLYGYGIPDLGKALFMLQGINPIPLNDESLVRIFPNPFKDHLTISFYSHDSQEIAIELLTMNGKRLFMDKKKVGLTSLNSLDIDSFSSLPAGMYIVRILTRSNRYEQKVIKGSH
jgi:hypothetical protein